MDTLACVTRVRQALDRLSILVSSTFLVALFCAPRVLTAQELNTVAVEEGLTQEQQIIHILNRLGYGPRPGDIDRVMAMGLQAYIEQQLRPERIPDPVVEEKLADFVGLNLTIDAGVEAFRAVAPRSHRRRLQSRADLLADQMAKGDSSDRPALHPSSSGPVRRRLLNPRASAIAPSLIKPREYEIYEAKLIRAVHSERQLLELMVDFWMNHFNVNADFGDHYLVADYEERAIRPRALARFEDLLVATATAPAMLLYLDNWLSSAPEEVVRRRLDAGHSVSPAASGRQALALRERQPFFDQAKGLNENYARELMELHTVGVEGGYTQEDVIQVALAFTGWTLSATREDGTNGTFAFDPLIHVDGDKLVMGQRIKSGGIDEGMQILNMLAHHPSTARFISTKLVRRFVADDPPAELVEAASRTFEQTGGDIREVLLTIFTHPDFVSPQYYQTKVKKPIEVVASGLRAVNAEIDFRERNDNITTNPQAPFVNRLSQFLTQMGEALYQHEAPDGYPDVASDWISTNALFKRLEFAIALANGKVPGVTVDLESAPPLFRQMGFPEPTPEQIATARSLIAKSETGGAGMMSGEMMDEGMMEPETDDQEMMQKPGMVTGEEAVRDTHVVAAAIVLGSPQFQKR